MIEKIDKKAIFIIDKLNSNGFEAYLVGGCVRDLLIGRKCYDYDITTNALPLDVKGIFSDFQIYSVGEKFGTVGIVIDDMVYEITTYRSEKKYINHRKPNNVKFEKNIESDLSRRDFTINAIAYNPINNELIDYFNGVSDINDGIIKSVGDSEKRFEEDGIRILRALRFSSQLGFKIEEKTKNAIYKLYNNALDTSFERRAIEIVKLIKGKNFKEVLIEYKDILNCFLDIFKYDDYIKYIDNYDFEILIMIMYYNHIDIIEKDLSLLQINKKNIYKLKTMCLILNKIDFSNVVSIRKMLFENNNKIKNIELDFNNILKAYNIINDNDGEKYSENLKSALSVCYSLKDLCINGEDLIGIVKKKFISKALNFALLKVILFECDNNKDDLLKIIDEQKEFF